MARTYIVTNVEAETAKEDKTEKDNGDALETPSLLSTSFSPPLPPTRYIITKEEKMEKDEDTALKTPELLLSLSSPPHVAVVTDIITKEEAETTKGGKEK